jgi:SAM-dependent methyltransferase
MGDTRRRAAATVTAMRREYRDANRRRWDELVPIHVDSDFYDVAGFKAGEGNVHIKPWILDEVGDVHGRSLVHLQCHFGLDTLAMARLGARVTGLDFSPAAIGQAAALASELDLDAEFVCADVYDAVKALGGRTFDVVFTGLGALCWLPDIRRWASVVASLVKPGGFLYLAEFHPVLWTFAWGEQRVCAPYLEKPEPYVDDHPGDYAEPDAKVTAPVSYEWNHGLGEIVSALIDAGLRLAFLNERVENLFNQTGFLVEREPGVWVMPEGELPMLFSLRADKPRARRPARGSGTGTHRRP